MLKCAAKLSPFLLLGKSPSRFVGLAEPLQGQKPGWRVHRASRPKAVFPGGEAGVREASRASPPHGSIPSPVSQCGASVIAARCVGCCSVLHRHMQRAASDARPFSRPCRIRLLGVACRARLASVGIPPGTLRPASMIAQVWRMVCANVPICSLHRAKWLLFAYRMGFYCYFCGVI